MAKQKPEIFEGVYRQKMPLLIARGLTPATAEQGMDLRLKRQLSFDIYYDTATGIFYAGNNQDKFKILPFSEDLAEVNEKTPLYNGGIQKTQKQFDSSKAPVYTRKDMILGTRLTEQEALTHLGWLEALNENRKLLERVVGHVFKEVKDRYKEDKAMGFNLRGCQQAPNIHALCLYYLDCRCDAYGGYDLDDYDTRLVGVSKKSGKATSQKISSLEESVSRAIEARKPFKTKGGIYVFVPDNELKTD